MPSTIQDCYRLFHQGSQALARIEKNGIKIDIDYLNRVIEQTGKKIRELEEEIKEDEVYKLWHEKKGGSLNLTSAKQLAEILFDELKIETETLTIKGKKSVDKRALEDIDLPFIRKLNRIKELKNAKGTFLGGIKRETYDGFIHPVVNLHTVKSGRSSEDSPNLQNVPFRNKEIGPLVRKCFIPRKGRVLAEIDYGALEWKVACCFWKDPEMLKYARTEADVHKDEAANCYALSKKQVSKDIRFYAKNQFVFPELYGSWWKQMARNLWDCIPRADLKTTDEISLRDWLKTKGIIELGNCNPKFGDPTKGTFERLIWETENRFRKKFSKFNTDKDRLWSDYQNKGYYETMTGFPLQGECTKNFLLNAVIQGPAFHLLLQSIINIQKELRRKKMRSLLVNEVHDCIILDVVIDELQDVLTIVKRTMTKDLPKQWDWIIVPLIAEVDVTPIDGSWADKQPWCEINGKWKVKDG